MVLVVGVVVMVVVMVVVVVVVVVVLVVVLAVELCIDMFTIRTLLKLMILIYNSAWKLFLKDEVN